MITGTQTMQNEIRNPLNSFGTIDAADEFITLPMRGLERLEKMGMNVKDILTELSLCFETEVVDKCFAEHYFQGELHAEVASLRESTHEALVKESRERGARRRTPKRKPRSARSCIK